MKNFILILISLFFLSCSGDLKIDKEKLTKIDVYYVPFDILSPVESKVENIKLDLYKKTIIGNDLNEISNLLIDLEPDKKNDFNQDNVYLMADFFYSDKKILRVLFDKNVFSISGNEYKSNKKLIKLLIQNHNW